ncbi:DUF397 domain-containing protein, partial [Streptomyces anthocyanicus]|uniref:DUF397 domain-containing protein n=1 Tax=Streptomyces anthocyanicus TaxID=68174 RepID=UPI0036C801C4
MARDLHWQKSTFSGGGDDEDCLEISATPTTLHLRESDTPTAILSPTSAALHALLTAVKYAPRRSSDAHWQKSSYSAGDADNDCLEICATPTLHLRESDTPATLLSPPPTPQNALLTAVKRQ